MVSTNGITYLTDAVSIFNFTNVSGLFEMVHNYFRVHVNPPLFIWLFLHCERSWLQRHVRHKEDYNNNQFRRFVKIMYLLLLLCTSKEYNKNF